MTEETGIGTPTCRATELGTVGLRGVEMDRRGRRDPAQVQRLVGYWKDPEATARTVVDGWLHTGDVGELDPEGRLKITDRKKEIIITSGGKNIAPSEIENRLKCSPYINEAIVIGDAKPYLTALIQIEYDNVAKWAQDRGLAEKELDHDDNELTATLKLRRKTLYGKFGEIIEEMYRN